GAVSDEAFTRLQHTKFPYIGDAAIVVQFENLRSAESSFRNTRKRFEFESGRPWLEWRHPAHKRSVRKCLRVRVSKEHNPWRFRSCRNCDHLRHNALGVTRLIGEDGKFFGCRYPVR